MKATIEDMLTIEDVARIKGISRTTVYNAMRRGEIIPLVILGRKVFTRSAIEEWQVSPHGGNRGGGRPRKDKATMPP